MVLESATLTEQELGGYCRRKGTYKDDIKAWKSQCINANSGSIEYPKKLKTELKEEKDKVRKIEKELRFKEKALAETAALLVLRKNVHAIFGGPRGRLISASDRIKTLKLIDEAVQAGIRLSPCCNEVGISTRSYERWSLTPESTEDKRPIVHRHPPKNKLSDEERAEILQVINSHEYADLVPAQIVPKLADQGIYIASESTIHKILGEEKQNTHRFKTKAPVKRVPPTHIATAQNQVWTWGITWLDGSVNGVYFKLYLILDMFSRMIVGYEV